MIIRKASVSDVDAVAKSYTELLKYEQVHGTTTNWVLDLYPTKAVAVGACEKDTLYVLVENDEICASMILNHYQSEEYGRIDWLCPAAGEKVLILHTLCIPPAKSHRGYGKQMVQFCLEKAAELGCDVVRIDTWSENVPAASLYRHMGFRYAGITDSLFQGVIPEKLIFFEKEVK
jgi:ribosomal protein S18 acetylase RimI-like enzyme